MQFSVISSGSKANATFVQCGRTRIIIDCGLSSRMLEGRLRVHGIDPASIDAILVTHEHSDHIAGVPTFSRRFKVPVFANPATAEFIKEAYAVEHFRTGQQFNVGDMAVNPFSIVHDASDPVGFTVEGEGIKFGQATDLGRITGGVKSSLKGCHALVLESNHDQEMLKNCDYPWELKQRISSSHGHLSNASAGAFLLDIVHSDLLHVVLGHLSENSNTPQCALETSRSFLNDVYNGTLSCGSVHQATPLFQIGAEDRKVAV